MRWWRSLVSIVSVILICVGIFLGGYLLGNRHGQRLADTSVTGFEIFWQVRDLLNNDFMGEIPTAQAQVYAATHGLVSAYNDPFTTFVEPGPREYERDELRGHFGGIGAYVSRNDTGDVVLTVMRDRPAAQAGVQDGDVLLAVDGQPITSRMTIEQVVVLIRGDVGTKVALTLRRAKRPDTFTLTVTRQRIETPSVEWRMLDEIHHIGYMRISIFSERTSQELQTGLADLAAQGVNKLVLDLRGNGGGLVEAAVDVTSQFVSSGVVLREQKRGGYEHFYPVKKVRSPAHTWQLALLVDGGTASASEIVAGALRDHGRAVLIGEKTYGKGSVQEVHELHDGSSLHVTVARWLTPNRHQIDQVGLQPDIPVPLTADDRASGYDPQLERAQTWLQDDH